MSEFEKACRDGNIDIVRYGISKGENNLNWGLRCACYGGHIDIVELLIS